MTTWQKSKQPKTTSWSFFFRPFLLILLQFNNVQKVTFVHHFCETIDSEQKGLYENYLPGAS
jgi:hypothetical protein